MSSARHRVVVWAQSYDISAQVGVGPALVRVEVAGHADSVGTEEYNEGLSMRRATIVYDYLTWKGVDAGRLAGPNGYGEVRPSDTNDTSEGRQRNLRTELPVQK